MTYIIHHINILHVILGLFLFLIINYFGSKSKGFGYVNFSDIIGQQNSFGFNFFFRVLTPSIFISFVSIIFYLIGFEESVNNIYLVTVFYFLIQSTYIVLKGYPSLINKRLFFITHIASMAVAYWFYKASLVKGLDYILPDSGNFRTEIWFILILYFYKVLNDYHPVSNMSSLRSIAITKKFRQFEKKYRHLLSEEFLKSEELYKIFFSIMIVEDLNRGKLFRLLERVLFRTGMIETTGIMQVRSDKYLTDPESIHLAQSLILSTIEKQKQEIGYTDDLIRRVAFAYNGTIYFDQINEVYHEISYPADQLPIYL